MLARVDQHLDKWLLWGQFHFNDVMLLVISFEPFISGKVSSCQKSQSSQAC